MAKVILKLEELQSYNGWSCYFPKDLIGIGNKWYTPARALGLNLIDYVETVIEKFKPNKVLFSNNKDDCLLIFYWNKQADMRKYKNWLNKLLRDGKVYIEIK